MRASKARSALERPACTQGPSALGLPPWRLGLRFWGSPQGLSWALGLPLWGLGLRAWGSALGLFAGLGLCRVQGVLRFKAAWG